ncbi:MAG: hypothetical protein ACI8PT_003061 [Gammaproteobacteria bacterium]|jgi:hypothetical protein
MPDMCKGVENALSSASTCGCAKTRRSPVDVDKLARKCNRIRSALHSQLIICWPDNRVAPSLTTRSEYGDA